MSTPYTLKRITDVEDSAPKFGFQEVQEARFAKDELEAERTGVSHHRLKAHRRQPFAHRHEQAEEIYLILAGSGRVKLGEDIVELRPLDAIRVAPEVTRAFEAVHLCREQRDTDERVEERQLVGDRRVAVELDESACERAGELVLSR